MAAGRKDWGLYIEEELIAHHPDHEKGGLDELSIDELAGKTADWQKANEVHADEAGSRPVTPYVGRVFFSTDSKRLSIGFGTDPADWYNIEAVDETDTDEVKNKLVSNKQAKDWTAAIGQVPAGLIALWTGTIANIPTGWLLCDGTSGTPNLLDKFIKCVPASTNPGGTGGTSSHSHTVNSHTHTGPNHTHGAGSYTAIVAYGATECAPDGVPAVESVSEAAPVDGTSGSGGTGATGAASPGTNSKSHIPPYYELAFIFRAA